MRQLLSPWHPLGSTELKAEAGPDCHPQDMPLQPEICQLWSTSKNFKTFQTRSTSRGPCVQIHESVGDIHTQTITICIFIATHYIVFPKQHHEESIISWFPTLNIDEVETEIHSGVVGIALRWELETRLPACACLC